MPDSSQAQNNNAPLNRGVISFRVSQNKYVSYAKIIRCHVLALQKYKQTCS